MLMMDSKLSLPSQPKRYPKFEIIIVNDGSTDSTLEKMIKNFDLEEVPFDYVQQIYTRPFKRVFKSKRVSVLARCPQNG